MNPLRARRLALEEAHNLTHDLESTVAAESLEAIQRIHDAIHRAGAGLPRSRDVLIRLAERGHDALADDERCPLCGNIGDQHDEDCEVADAMALYPHDPKGGAR